MGDFVYDTEDDHVRRLAHTVCLYDNNPVYLSDYLGRGVFLCTALLSKKNLEVDVRSPMFSARPFTLGYVNLKSRSFAGEGSNNIVYNLARSPRRQNHQGLYSENIEIRDIRNIHDIRGVSHDEKIRAVTALFEAYPSFEETIKLLTRVGDAYALSKTTALFVDDVGIIKVAFRGKTIAWVDKSKSFCRLPETSFSDFYCQFLGELNVKGVVENPYE